MQHIEVAVGVILSDDNTVLIAERPPGKIMPGLWEFPGGKIEAEETVEAALKRELQEELAIECHAFSHFLTVEEDYPEQDRHVKLYVYLIKDYQNEPQGVEGQIIKWCPISALTQYQFPSANHPIIEKLQADLQT